uniref:Uncharacterized protein n=1 Tax=Romanomermis culicivorax TaxID=13658 RepID=A0A915HN65_ROMCU
MTLNQNEAVQCASQRYRVKDQCKNSYDYRQSIDGSVFFVQASLYLLKRIKIRLFHYFSCF